ncbi:CapA family protein [Mesorhizobium sp. M1148]|uniref:CapA family protein n=2 Tax=unclassified Mesorhizobium TaxID=325217 RepID=UPI0003F5E353|nr:MULTISPECIES: CapA family protein [unclassified Mesorhizobium]
MDAGLGPTNMYAEDRTAFRPARPGVNRLNTVRKIGVPDGHFSRLARLSAQLQSSPFELANYAQPEDPVEASAGTEINFYGTVFAQAADFGRLIEVDQRSAAIHLSDIRHAAAQGDFVIAYLHHHHWEPGWQDVPRWVQSFARMCIDAGANLFVSHGAPVLQAVEIYNGAPIFYGLGNFLFHVHPAPRFPLRRWVPIWPLLIRETVPPRRSRPAGGLWLPGFRPHHSGTRRNEARH